MIPKCRSSQGRTLGVLLVIGILVQPLGRDAQGIVINEIMYHDSDLDDTPFEWIEIYNERLDPFDLSGYTICDGVDFVFPEGTYMEGYSYLVVCSNVAAFESKYDTTGLTVIGDWVGALRNGGEKLEICNVAGIPALEVDYNDRGKWPGAADGTGHTLALVSPYTDVDDADNWRHSLQIGGTPGAWNGFTGETSTAPPTFNGMDGSGFILEWLVLGPYLTGLACNVGLPTLEADYLRGTSSPVQTDLVWEEGQVVNTNFSLAASDGLHQNAGTAQPTVELHRSFSDTINFNDGVWPPNPDNVMGYAFTYVDNVTGSPLAATLAYASDDQISILLNGSVVESIDECRADDGAGAIQNRANVTLNAGKNLIAVKVFENGGGWAFRLRVEGRNTNQPITSPSTIQVTTDVNAGLGFDGSGTPILDPSDPGGGDPGDPTLPGDAPVVINEAFLPATGSRWVELYNRTGSPIDLDGYYFTDIPGDLTRSQFLGSTVVPARGYISFTDVELGLDFQITELRDRVFMALVEPGGDVVVDAHNFEVAVEGFSEARIPDGDREFDEVADPTREAPNSISPTTDIVINEIMYKAIDGDRNREYLELANVADTEVDLSGWSLTRGIDFDFAPGTTIPAGGFLVVARNPDLIRSIYGLSTTEVVGPQQDPVALDRFGSLRDSGERVTLKDELGRTVDTVRFHDGGEWPRWADGHGSSLELIDPFQDNRFGQAWDASDDSDKAPVGTFSYVARHGNRDSELHVLLLNRGITVVDDISIIGGGLQTQDTPLIDRGEVWNYIKGETPPPAGWEQPGFNDGGWLSGATSIGYGDGDDATILDDMENGYMTIFCRKTFQVSNPGAIDELVLSIIIDDAFIAYLNGTQVAEFNTTGAAYDSPAASAVSNGDLVERDISQFKNLLVAGTNTLAIQVHNAGLGSSDLTFNPSLIDRTTTATGGTEQLSNGRFESSTSGWMIEGTHVRSGRTTEDPIAGSGSLKIIASGRGDNKVNRIETPDLSDIGLSNLTPGEDVQISLKARWVVGSQTLLTHGYEHEMARAHDLLVPENLGTPGQPNSVTLRQIDRNGGNLGPVFTDLVQDPAVPGANEDVRIRVRVMDADGLQGNSVRLRYSLNSPSPSPSSLTMSSLGNGWYEATIPGQGLGVKVVFHVTASDSQGVAGRYPVDVSERTHPLLLRPSSPGLNDHRYFVYRHAEKNPSTAYHNYRFWMTDADESFLNNRRLHSNDLVPGSFIFGGDTIYHEAGARFSGSPFARGGWGGSFRVAMPRGNRLHETIRKFNMENHQGGVTSAKERISHYLIRHTNGGATVTPYSDLQIMVRWQINDRASGTREHVWVPDVQFISAWYPDDDDGAFFEMDDRFLISDTGNRVNNRDARVLYPPPSPTSDGNGENKENYRWFFGLRAENGADDFSELIDFARVMDPGTTRDPDYLEQIWDVANVEEMLRIWAVRMNTDDWDQWGANRGKNCYLFRPDIDQRWNLLAWDMELTYGGTGSFLIPTNPTASFNIGGFSEVNRMFNQIPIRRIYYGILAEMVQGGDAWFGSSHLSAFTNMMAAIGMSSTGVAAPGGVIDQRANILRDRISSVVYPTVRFRITTNSGNDFSTPDRTVQLGGTAPVDVGVVVVTNNGGEPTELPVDFTGMTAWTLANIPLVPGANNLQLWGFDRVNNLVETDTITVTSTAPAWDPPAISAITPTASLPGEVVEIQGTDFHDGLKVFFGATQATVVAYDEFGPSPDLIQVEVPDGVGPVDVTVVNLDGKISAPQSFTILEPAPTFIRGDATYDRFLDIGDAVKIMFHLFRSEPLPCLEAADVDDNGLLEVTDVVYVLEYLFLNGNAPPAPFPLAGQDLDGDTLTCEG